MEIWDLGTWSHKSCMKLKESEMTEMKHVTSQDGRDSQVDGVVVEVEDNGNVVAGQ